MENKKDNAALSEELLDKVSGGAEQYSLEQLAEGQITSTERGLDGVCSRCGGPAYRVTQKGTYGPFAIEKTWRECPKDGPIGV